MDEGGDAAAVADDRELPLAHGLDQAVVVGAVEAAVAERDPAGVRDRLVEIAHRGSSFFHACHGGGLEWIVFAGDRATFARIPEAGEALRDEPGHAGLAGSRKERVGALASKPVGLGEGAIEVPGEPHIRQSRRLVDDRVGLRFQQDLAHGALVEQVEPNRFRPERSYTFGASR